MPEIARTSSSLPTIFSQLMNSAPVRPRSFTFGAISTSISSQFNAAFVSITSYMFYFIRIPFVSRFNQTIGFIIPTPLVFLQLKYLTNDNKTPFTAHPYTMGVAVFSTFMYYLACAVQLRYCLRQFSDLSRNCMVLFGDISVASLMSIFLPDWVRPLLYIVLGLISASEFLQKLFVEETGGAFWARTPVLELFRKTLFLGESTNTSQIIKSNTQLLLFS